MKKFNLIFVLILLFAFTAVSQTVYVTKTGKKYHTAGCSYLKSSIPLDLDKALDRGYTACSRCLPPTKTAESRQNIMEKEEVKKEQTTTTKKKSTTTSSRCLATTKKGTQCKRNAAPGSNYCWQHK